jgi:hypothetical protein
MRGVIRSIMKRRGDFGEVTAVFGVRVPEDFPFRNEMDDWKQARIETLLTVSRPEGKRRLCAGALQRGHGEARQARRPDMWHEGHDEPQPSGTVFPRKGLGHSAGRKEWL